MLGTETCMTVSSVMLLGTPVGISVAFWSYISMLASSASMASLKSSSMLGGPACSTALTDGTLASRPAWAKAFSAGANTASTNAAPTANLFASINP